MLQETVLRVSPQNNPDPERLNICAPSFVCAQADENVIKTQCANIGVELLHIILEPMGRNTAPVAAIIADIFASSDDKDDQGMIVLLPADHFIADDPTFWRCIGQGVDTAAQGKLVTLGIMPTGPNTGYGYIHQGESVDDGVYAVNAFVEKPNLSTAEAYLSSGDYVWNAGIFLFTPQAMLDSFAEHSPDILAACQTTVKKSRFDNICVFLDEASFAACPSQSIDYAIMEKSDRVCVVAPVDVGWNDIGSWAELAKMNTDEDKSIGTKGDVIALDCTDTYLHTDGPLIAGIGLENLIVIATNDSVLVLPKDRAQDVKKIVAQLKKEGRVSLC